MITIEFKPEYKNIVDEYAPKQTIGGLTNLSSYDIAKASRQDFQYTGIYGEIAWHLFRYNNLDKLISTLDSKYKELRPLRKGDDGIDDLLSFRNSTRKVDIKSTHSVSDNIEHLNLIVPKREYHENMIYVAAFIIGPNRQNPTHAILAGWANNEKITKVWRPDEPTKLCVPVAELRNISSLKKCFDAQ